MGNKRVKKLLRKGYKLNKVCDKVATKIWGKNRIYAVYYTLGKRWAVISTGNLHHTKTYRVTSNGKYSMWKWGSIVHRINRELTQVYNGEPIAVTLNPKPEWWEVEVEVVDEYSNVHYYTYKVIKNRLGTFRGRKAVKETIRII